MLQAVVREPERGERVVVRPDRSVVVRHRVVARLAQGDGADPPAGEERLVGQRGGHLAGSLRADQPHRQAVPGIRGAHPALLLCAVQRQGVRGEVFAPERALEAGPELLRERTLTAAQRFIPERQGHLRHGPPGREHVALHLAERDGPLGQPPVRVEDRVPGVLPALVAQTGGRSTRVLDEAVPVRVAVGLDPGQRSLEVRPQLLHQRAGRRWRGGTRRRGRGRAAWCPPPRSTGRRAPRPGPPSHPRGSRGRSSRARRPPRPTSAWTGSRRGSGAPPPPPRAGSRASAAR